MSYRTAPLFIALLVLPLGLIGCDASSIASAEIEAAAGSEIQGPYPLCPWNQYTYTGASFSHWAIVPGTGTATFRAPFSSTNNPTQVQGNSAGSVELRAYRTNGTYSSKALYYNPDC